MPPLSNRLWTRIIELPRTLWTHKKKTVFFSGAGALAVNYLNNRQMSAAILRSYCELAKTYGDRATDGDSRSRRVTVLMNRWAMNGRCRMNFESTALQMLHLAGLEVNVISAADAEQLENLAAAVDQQEADAIYVVGGDGTLSRVVTGMYSTEGNAPLLPVGIFPGGFTSSVLHSVLPPSAVQPIVILQCESALALIQQVTTNIPVLRLTNNQQSASAEPPRVVYGVSHVHLGSYANANVLQWKYWYYWRMRHWFTYFWNGLKDSCAWFNVNVGPVSDSRLSFMSEGFARATANSKCHAADKSFYVNTLHLRSLQVQLTNNLSCLQYVFFDGEPLLDTQSLQIDIATRPLTLFASTRILLNKS